MIRAAFVALLLAAAPAWAADLSTAQLQALKTWVATNAPGQTDEQIVATLNANAAPDFYVWRTNVSETEYTQTSGVDVANGGAATTWSWVGTGFIGRSQGERDTWARLFKDGSVNPSLPNVRQAFTDILSGNTAPAPANRNHMTVVSKRKATAGEKLYAAGTGTFASPATMAVEGLITDANITAARNLP